MERPKHVVVVDDDADVSDVIVALLEEGKYKVSTAVHGAGLRALLDAAPGAVDAVVLDGSMRGESSASLAAHLKDLRLPLIMISGDPPKMEAAEKGNLQLLWKPFTQEELLDAVEQALASGAFGQRAKESPLPPATTY
jgi:DNA-binding NtrC family response regulator